MRNYEPMWLKNCNTTTTTKENSAGNFGWLRGIVTWKEQMFRTCASEGKLIIFMGENVYVGNGAKITVLYENRVIGDL